MRYILLLIACANLGFVWSQDVKKDLVKMGKLYAKSINVEMSTEVSVFKSRGDKAPLYKNEAVLKKQGNLFFYDLGSSQLCINNREMILINMDAKQMIIDNLDKKIVKDYENNFNVMAIDSTLKLAQSVEFIGSPNGVKHYRFKYAENIIEQIDLFISDKGVLEKLEYDYQQELFPDYNHVVIKYTKVDFSPSIDVSLFSSKSFYIKKERSFFGTGVYTNFVVLNNNTL